MVVRYLQSRGCADMMYKDDTTEKERERNKNDKMQVLSKKEWRLFTYIPRNH